MTSLIRPETIVSVMGLPSRLAPRGCLIRLVPIMTRFMTVVVTALIFIRLLNVRHRRNSLPTVAAASINVSVIPRLILTALVMIRRLKEMSVSTKPALVMPPVPVRRITTAPMTVRNIMPRRATLFVKPRGRITAAIATIKTLVMTVPNGGTTALLNAKCHIMTIAEIAIIMTTATAVCNGGMTVRRNVKSLILMAAEITMQLSPAARRMPLARLSQIARPRSHLGPVTLATKSQGTAA